MESLISDYGYLAVLCGTFLEGETVLVLGGFAAHRGFLELHWVMFLAFIGTLAGDQLYYYLGRTRGTAFLASRPTWKTKAARVFRLLESNETMVILGFRFFYGVRTVAPFVIGMSQVAPARYLALNALGAAVWAISIGSLGYAFGHALELFLEDLKRYEMIVLLSLAGIGVSIWVGYFARQRARRSKARSETAPPITK